MVDGIGIVDCWGFQTIYAHRVYRAIHNYLKSTINSVADIERDIVRELYGTSEPIASNKHVRTYQPSRVDISLPLHRSGRCWLCAQYHMRVKTPAGAVLEADA